MLSVVGGYYCWCSQRKQLSSVFCCRPRNFRYKASAYSILLIQLLTGPAEELGGSRPHFLENHKESLRKSPPPPQFESLVSPPPPPHFQSSSVVPVNLKVCVPGAPHTYFDDGGRGGGGVRGIFLGLKCWPKGMFLGL